MSNSDTPTGANGNKQELKVTRTNEADKLLDKYFEDLREEGYEKINIHALIFDVPEVNIKSKVVDEENSKNKLGDVINVLESGKASIELQKLLDAFLSKTKSAPKSKIEKKINKLKEEQIARKQEQEDVKSIDGRE